METRKAKRLPVWLADIVAAAFFFFLVMLEMHELGLLLGQSAPADARLVAISASSLAKILFLALIVTMYLVRQEAADRACGFMPRIAALSGTFMIYLVSLFPAPEPGLAQSLAGLALVGLGSVLSAAVVGVLGKSFSLMAEARRLVTRGPYSLVRHPLYLAEEVAVFGIVLLYLSLPAVLLLAAHGAVQLQRMKNEETVLGRAFPEYKSYKARTRRLIPGLY